MADCASSGLSWSTSSLPDDDDYQIRVDNVFTQATNDTGVFTIDNTDPVIMAGTIVAPTTTWAGTVAQTISWAAGNISDNLGLASSPVSFSYSVDNGEFLAITGATGIANSGSASWTPTNVNSSNVKLKLRVEDKAGNFAEQVTGAFAIDSRKPVATVAIDDVTITDANRTKTVTVTYDEEMKTASVPTIAFSDGGVWTLSGGAWNPGSNTVWVGNYTRTDGGDVATGVKATVTGALDAAGNSPESATSVISFDIDTQNPAVAANGAVALPNPAKAGAVTVSVGFSEKMKATAVPEVLIQPIMGAAISAASGSYNGTFDVWTANFTLPVDAATGTATIKVNGAQDEVGNSMVTNDSAGTFSIDTTVPTVNAIAFDTLRIYDEDLEQKVTVTFSEAMSKTKEAEPVIVFSSVSAVSKGDGGWGTNDTVWTETLTITDAAAGQQLSDIIATVSGAQDVAGNGISATDSGSNKFDIDTVNPTVVLSDDNSKGFVKDADTINITATFSEPVVAPKIKFGYSNTEASMTYVAGSLTATYPWDVPAGNDGTWGVEIIATDIFGNDNAAATGEISYKIDNAAPTAGVTYSINHAVKGGNTQTITATFSEDVVNTPTIALSGAATLAATNMSGSGMIWTYGYGVPGAVSGDVTVVLAATDAAGNPVGAVSGNTFTIDNSIPTVAIASPVAGLHRSSVPLTFTGTDATTAISCKYKIDDDAETSAACTSGIATDVTIPAATGTITDGKHTVTVKVSDEAGNVLAVTSSEFVFTSDNILTVPTDYSSIQAAIDAASAGDTISVLPGTYTENVNVNKGVKIESFGTEAGTTVAGSITVAANTSGVTIDDLTIANPDGTNGILVYGGVSNISITNNVLSNIGTGASVTGTVQAIYLSDISTNVTVSDNTVSGVGNIASGSSKGIYVGDTSKSGLITGLVINNNDISNVRAKIVTSGGKGAYGIQINFGGETRGVQITGNTISDLEGLWATGIGLEWNTPDAVVTGNTISGLVDHKAEDDNSGLKLEDNLSANTVVIHDNKFGLGIIGVKNSVSGQTVTAENNWWGTPNKALIKTSGSVDFAPWRLSDSMDGNGALNGKLSSDASLTVGATGADFTSIQAAIDAVASAATPNATINVAAGIYNENLTIPAGLTGLTISGRDKANTFLKVTSGDAVTTSSSVIIEKFTIDCQGSGKDGIHVNSGSGITVTIQDNSILNYAEEGVIVYGGGTLNVLNNKISGVGTENGYSVDSIYTRDGVTATIRGNELSNNIYANYANGTSAGIAAHAGDHIIAIGNDIHSNTIGIHAKSGSSIDTTPAEGNQGKNAFAENTFNFYFEDDNTSLTETFDLSENWWGSKVKSEIAGKIFGGVSSFAPWYMQAEMTSLSSSDNTKPTVVLSHTVNSESIARTSVKDADTVVLTATFTEANGIEEATALAPRITIGSSVMNAPMTKVSNLVWTYSWDVPAGDVASNAVSVLAYDIIGNLNAAATGSTNFRIDNTAPNFNLTATGSNYGVDAGPTMADSISLKNMNDTTESGGVFNSDIASAFYGFSETTDCVPSSTNAIDYTTVATVTNGHTVTFTVTGNHTNYLCVKAIDIAGNIGYQVIGNDYSNPVPKLNVDNTKPILAVVAAVTTPTNDDTPTFVFSSTEAGTIVYGGDCSSSTTAATAAANGVADNSVTFNALAAGTYSNCTIMVRDGAGNESVALAVPLFTIDLTAPAIGITAPTTDAKVNGTETISFTGGEKAPQCSVDNSTWTACVSGSTTLTGILWFTALTESAFTLYVKDTDEAGNTGNASVSLTKDISAPTITKVSSDTVEGTYKESDKIDIDVTFSEKVTGNVTVALNTNRTCTFSVANAMSGTCDYTVGAGENTTQLATTLSGHLVDEAGNAMMVFTPAFDKNIVIDTKAPILSEITSVATPGKVTTPAYVFSSDEAGTISYDGGCASATTSAAAAGNTVTFYALADGTYAGCQLRVTDAVGNASAWLPVSPFVIDTKAPVISNLTPADLSTSLDGTPAIGAEFADAGVGVSVASIHLTLTEYADADDFAIKGVAGVSYTPTVPLANGTYHASVSVTDALGNASSASWKFVVNKAVTGVSVSADKTSVIANGTASAKITATVLSNGSPVMGATVDFATTIGELSSVTPTNAQGQATALLKSTVTGASTVTATYDSSSGLAQNTVVVTFTSAAAPTATILPLDNAKDVAVTVHPVITFSTLMDEMTINQNTVQLRRYADDSIVASTPAPATVSGKTVVTITPDEYLANGTQYYYFVAGVENASGIAVGTWSKSGHEFATVAATATQAVIPLQLGWNLISLPLIPNNTAIGSVLAGLSGSAVVDTVQYYDAKTLGWKSYTPLASPVGTLETMEAGKGYWINMTTPGTLTVTGAEWPAAGQTVPLSYSVIGRQWNLIGFKSMISKLAGEYISQMGDNDVIWVYKNGKQTALKKTDYLDPGYGYWFYTYNDSFDIIPQ